MEVNDIMKVTTVASSSVLKKNESLHVPQEEHFILDVFDRKFMYAHLKVRVRTFHETRILIVRNLIVQDSHKSLTK